MLQFHINMSPFFSFRFHVTLVKLTEAGGSLATKVHGIQAHGALGSSHVESHCEAVRGVVVHRPLSLPLSVSLTVLQTTAIL